MKRLVLLSLFVLAFASISQAALVSYNVSVNTGGVNGIPNNFAGSVFFTFGPGLGGVVDPATVSIQSFTPQSRLNATIDRSDPAQVTGTLASTVTLSNAASNYFAQGFTYNGGPITFLLQFNTNPSGAATAGSSFGFALQNPDGSQSFLTSQPDGFSLTANINARTGAISTQTYPTDRGAAAVVTISPQAAVPEPASWSLLAGGLALLAWRKRRPAAASTRDR